MIGKKNITAFSRPISFSLVNQTLIYAIVIASVSFVSAYLILNQKWYYLIGLVFTTVYISLALRHQWEILLVLIFFVDLIWGYAMRRGSYILSSFIIDHSLLLLFATLLYYFAWKRLKTHKNIGIKNFTSKEYMLIVIFTVLLFVGGLTWLEFRDTPPYEWLRFGLAGLGAFILGNEVGRDPKRVQRLAIALFVFLVMVSLEISARRWLDFELVPVHLGYDDYIGTRFGITGYKYLPLFAGKGGDALLMAIAIAIGIGLVVSLKSYLWKIASITGLVPVSSVLVLNLDRASWVAGTSVLIFWTFILLRYIGGRKIGWTIICLIVAEITGMFVLAERSGGGVRNYFSEFIISDRYLLWYSTLKSLLQFPLLGIGYRNLDQFALIMHHASPTTPYQSPLDDTIGQYVHPHNSYLDLVTFGGVPTFVIFSIFLGKVLWRGWKSFQTSGDKNFRITLFTIYSALLALCIFSFFNPHLWVWPTNLLFWILSGTVAGLSQVVKQYVNHKEDNRKKIIL